MSSAIAFGIHLPTDQIANVIVNVVDSAGVTGCKVKNSFENLTRSNPEP